MAANSIEAGRAFMRLFIDDSQFRRGLTKAGQRLQAFGKSIAGIGAGFLKFGASLAAPLAATVKFASDTEETMSKFNTVFGDSADEVKAFGDNLAKAVGRSKTDLADFLAGFQDLLVPIGIDPDVAKESSKTLTQLAVDLASFNNKADADSVRDLQAALTGSSEVMKKYGVIVNQTAINQKLLAQGIAAADATEQQKVFARLQIILEGTTAAQGDAARTADSFANSMKGLWSSVKDTGSAIGQTFLKPLAAIARLATRAVVAIEEFAIANAGIIRTVGAAVAAVTAVGGVLVTLGGVAIVTGLAISGLSTIIGAAGAVLGALLSPIGLVVAGVTAMGVAIVKYTNAGSVALDFLKERFGGLVTVVKSTLGAILKALGTGDLQLAAEAAFAGLSVAAAVASANVRQIWGSLKGQLIGVWYDAVAGISVAMSIVDEAWARTVGGMKKTWSDFTTGMRVLWIDAVALLKKESPQATLKKIAEVIKDNSAAAERIKAESNANVERIQAGRQAVLEAIDSQERESRQKLSDEVVAAAQAAEAAKKKLEAITKRVDQKTGDAAKAGSAGDNLADRLAKAKIDIPRGLSSAQEKIESRGTFSGRAAAAGALSVAGSVDEKQLGELQGIKAAANKIAKNTKFGGVIPVGAG